MTELNMTHLNMTQLNETRPNTDFRNRLQLTRTGLIERAEVRLPMVEVSVELAARLDVEIARRAPALLRRA